MATATPVHGWQVPSLGDAPNIETAVGTIAAQIDRRAVPIYSTTGARDTAIPGPIEGMMSYVTGTDELYCYSGSLWLGTKPRCVFKTANENVISSTAFQNDDHLFISLEANSRYIVDCYIKYAGESGAGTGDFKTTWTVPASATGTRFCVGAPTSTTSQNDTNVLTTGFSITGALTYGTNTAADSFYARETLNITTVSSGTLQLQWAQVISNANNTTVQTDSFLSCLKVG